MNYQIFAALYDTLMEEAPYDRWVDYVKTRIGRESLSDMAVLDVGCGTGELLVRLHKEGAIVTGVDLSTDMLAVAKEKCERYDVSASLIEQSMTDLTDLGHFDLVTIFCDSLNYLETADEVRRTFKGVYEHLNHGGYFLFDVHSVYKIEHEFINHTFAEDADEIAYIWTSFAGEFPASVEHELSFFIRDDDHRYVKREELHRQRTFPVEQYEKWLEEAGFQVANVSADFEPAQPTARSERIFFCARKKD